MRSVVIDANLLVLLIVGLVDRQLIQKHKRTRSFEPADFDLLTQILRGYEDVVVTPNVMTEASNLAAQVAEPSLTAVRQRLAAITSLQREEYRPSIDVVQHKDFLRLGLTDCGLLDVIGIDIPLLTADHDLYVAAARKNHQATNFNHLRQARLLGV